MKGRWFPSSCWLQSFDKSHDAIAFMATQAHYWFMLCSNTSRSFLQFPVTAPSMQWCMGLLRTKCRTQRLVTFNIVQLASAHSSSLFRSFCRDFLPRGRKTSPQLCHLETYWGAFNPLVHIISEDIKQEGLQYRCLGSTTYCSLDLIWSTTIFWSRPYRQIFTNLREALNYIGLQKKEKP